jgi:hypothetical protein
MKRAHTIFSSLLLLLALSACNGSGYLPCQVQVNGICYDKPKASNPPITASWQIIDADTLKPIPGVWISFYWKKFPDGEQRGGTCARNVIGQTDANGRFSNTAKDGSWMFADVHMFKGGYRQIRTEFLPERTALTDRIKVNQEYVGKCPAFESELKSMGYQLDTANTTNAYFKTFEVGGNLEAMLSAAWEPQGETQYWVSKRGIPDGQDMHALAMYPCYSRALGKTDPDAEFVGYKGLDRDKNGRWSRAIAIDALDTVCDEKWDSVPSDFKWTQSKEYAGPASMLVGEANFAALTKIHPDYVAIPYSAGGSTRAMTRTERVAFCGFVRPYAKNNGD